jgi:hypothetical protein
MLSYVVLNVDMLAHILCVFMQSVIMLSVSIMSIFKLSATI